ncbi:MAG: T9SS type A sorting domain-containing protein [Bacteroidetes bacterium]|nr:T9SS type A sorting domain-containing protein [Bacteroidota bacterium]
MIRNENAIELKNNSGNSFNVKFYQIDGTMRFENLLSESLNINTANYSKGIYILELNDEMNRERYIQKIVIE